MEEQKEHYDYNQSFKECVEYFEGDELAANVFLSKYALRDDNNNLLEKTPTDMHWRMAKEFARIEKKKYKNTKILPLTEEEIFSYLDHFKKIIPQGSLMYGLGNNKQYVTLSNCYVIDSPLDSYSGIMHTDEQLVQISKRRGGCGLDISNLRPAGTATTNAAKTSSGILSFMERYSNSIREVGQFGRRGALLISLDVHHPEVLEFANVKKDLTKVTGANISIKLTDDFLNAVKNDEEYEQRWPVDSKTPQITKMVNARKVWKQIIENAHAVAEPGLLFWDNIIKESPADCYAEFGFKTLSTNPCSELPLPPGDSCRLLLLNLITYVKNAFTKDAYFDFDIFYKDAQIAQRFMDDVVDMEEEHIDRILQKIKNDPEPQNIKANELQLWKNIKEMCTRGRRTGTGVTALGDSLAALGVKYASEKSLDIVNNIYKTLKLGCYRSSVDMAKELGPFSVWNHDLEKNNVFLLRLQNEDPQLWKDMKKYGRRNIALLTTAPAGSVSVLTQTTSGIEPLFQMTYTRRKKINPNDQNIRVDFIDESGDHWQEFDVYHMQLKKWMEITGETDMKQSPWYGCCAQEINWINRVKLQAAAQPHICHSISSTINLPNDVTVEEVAKIYETAWQEGLKGITVYRDGCRTGVMVNKKDKCSSITKTEAPKRPKELFCDMYHASVKGQEYIVAVGLFDNEPYEVFAGKNGQVSKSIKSGIIRKVKRGCYQLLSADNQVILESIIDLETPEEEAMTRIISTALRHGADISFIVHQLEKTKGELTSFAKSVARTLKKYVKDGTTVSGEECEECHGTLIRENGCVICKNCGWTKCS